MPRFKEQAIVLRQTDWSETSQIVTLLTPGQGKLRGLAKGCKRTSPSSVARFSGGFEALTLGQALGSLRANVGLTTITEWDLQEPFPHLRNNYDAMQLAYYAADLINALLQDGDPHPGVFDALRRLLTELAQPPMRQAALLRFQWRLLIDCGYKPVLEADARTGAILPETGTVIFDPRAGGLRIDDSTSPATPVAPASGDPGPGPWRVRMETVALLCAVARETEDPASKSWSTTTESAIVQRANRLLCAYLRAALDRELPTMSNILR